MDGQIDRAAMLRALTERKPAQPRVACFELVSDDIYARAAADACAAGELRDENGAVMTACGKDYIAAGLAARRLPARATVGSAGYDFFSPVAFRLAPGDSVTVPTGVRCAMDPSWVLMIGPKSGKGNRYRVMLRNTMAFIDSDYYFSDNEGHILLKLINDNYDGAALQIAAGDSLMQGLFLPYGVTLDDAADGIRNGGFGSTVR